MGGEVYIGVRSRYCRQRRGIAYCIQAVGLYVRYYFCQRQAHEGYLSRILPRRKVRATVCVAVVGVGGLLGCLRQFDDTSRRCQMVDQHPPRLVAQAAEYEVHIAVSAVEVGIQYALLLALRQFAHERHAQQLAAVEHEYYDIPLVERFARLDPLGQEELLCLYDEPAYHIVGQYGGFAVVRLCLFYRDDSLRVVAAGLLRAALGIVAGACREHQRRRGDEM